MLNIKLINLIFRL